MHDVSVIIPVRDEMRGRLLETVISAHRSDPAEIILVDDGSAIPVTDVPLARVIRQDAAGISAAMNRGIGAATSGYVAWLSVGDEFYPHKFERTLGLAPAVCHLIKDGHHPVPRRLRWDNQICGAATVVMTDVAREIPFDEGLQYCVDWDWSARIEFDGPGWTLVEEVLGESHQHPWGHTARAQAGEARKVRDRDRATVSRRWRQ